MQITVRYPSGLTYTLQATWQVGKRGPALRVVGDQRVMGDPVQDGTPWWGDPRALYIETETGRVLWHPKEHLDLMPPFMREWLEQHPEWS